MNESATEKQMALIGTLCKELDIAAPKRILSKSEADSFIKELIAKANNGIADKSATFDKEYPIAFQAMIKACAVLYANRTDKSFKDIIKEVKEVY